MLKNSFLSIFFLLTIGSFAQEVKNDTIKKDIDIIENDTILSDTIQLQEVVIYKQKLDPEALKQFLLLQNRVYKVYPFAKTAGDRLSLLNKNMDKLKSTKEKRRYFKIAEDYMENEFKAKLKKLSRKQGQILVKLIHRQTGVTTYDLIKNYKSGWKAFWSNSTASLFDISLKAEYRPYKDNEDFLIETILFRAFNSGRLIEQKAANPLDINDLTDFWVSKAEELDKKKKE